MSNELRQVSLLFLLRDDKILLAMKKRGFGAGRWNGVGGKQDSGEEIEDTAARECEEEIGVTPIALKKVAILDFLFPKNKADKDFNQQVHVFFCNEWEGEPTESAEMKPQWYPVSQIPYENMWSDDIIWLPKVIGGELIKAVFSFDDYDQFTDHTVTEVSSF